MASGGYHPSKTSKSDVRRQSNWQRSVSSDHDDAQSLNSFHSDMRINNWDFSDLRLSNLGGDSKRRKKSKGNPEREREQSLSMDSPPSEKKQHTPSSYPRTKITSNTPTSERMALENLKQHISFSDLDDQVSTDGDRNNKRLVSQSRRRGHNASLNSSDVTHDRRTNRKNNVEYTIKEQAANGNEITARLSQIRDFMKQARSMLDAMERLGERNKSEDVEKVRKLIRNLQEQEQGYRDLLERSLSQHNDEDVAAGGDGVKMGTKNDSDDDTSVELEVETEESETTETSHHSRPRIESKLGMESEGDRDDDEEKYREPVRGSARGSGENENSNRAMELDNALVHGHHSSSGISGQEAEESERGVTAQSGEASSDRRMEILRILREKEQQLEALKKHEDELNTRRRLAEKRLLDIKTRDNQASATLAALTAGRQMLERRIVSTNTTPFDIPNWDTNGHDDEAGVVGEDRQLKSNIVGYAESDEEDNSKVREVESLPIDLLELKRQLNYLKNEFSQTNGAAKNMEPESQAPVEGREQQLQNKLHELQSKKQRMDLLLQQLQLLHSAPSENPRNNETNLQISNIQPPTSSSTPNIPATKQLQILSEKSGAHTAPPPPTSLQTGANSAAAASLQGAIGDAMGLFAQLAGDAITNKEPAPVEPHVLQEVDEKLRRLQEFRSQLDQLKSMVHHFQSEKDEMSALKEGQQVSVLQMPDYRDGDRGAGRQMESSNKSNHSSLQELHKPQQKRHQMQLPPPQDLLPQQPVQRPPRQPGEKGRAAAVASLQNVVQLLNLAGTDPGDEHSDEDNMSVSRSESQWSNLGPWDNDPEIQEKVRKLKTAKERLQQLQDLVALVQESSEPTRSLPEDFRGNLATAEVRAVAQAAQTEEPNVSVSEGELPSESYRIQQNSRDNELNEMEDPRAELVRLRKERAMLLEIQSQMQRLQKQVGQTSGVQGRAERNSDSEKPGLNPTQNTTVVTFASNDELYSKMRRQRILHEELRSKKKELEAIMKKDRNKRQYSRNQDTHSDTVSLNTDACGNAASVDATMATWGGSTVDNLENITKDEDTQAMHDQGDGEEDGYPSDGMVLLEEDEQGSDIGTYTIEQDARQGHTMRKRINASLDARPKTSRGRLAYPQPASSDREPGVKMSARDHSQSRSSYSPQVLTRDEDDRRQPLRWGQDEVAFRGTDHDWFRSIESRLNGLSSAVDTLLRKSEIDGKQLSVSLSQENAQQSTGLMSPMQEQMLQLQQQSMMLSFGQLVHSLARQQGDINLLQQQMQALQLQVQTVHHDHGYQASPVPGVGLPNIIRPPQTNPALGAGGFPLQAAADLGTQAFLFNHQQVPSSLTQNNQNTSAPATVIGNFSSNYPGLHFQYNALGLSASNVLQGLGTRPVGVPSSVIETNVSDDTGPPKGKASGCNLSPRSRTCLGSQHWRHSQVSQEGSVCSTTGDFQSANTHQSTAPPQGHTYANKLKSFRGWVHQRPPTAGSPQNDANQRQEDESPLNSHKRNSRKSSKQMVESHGVPASGPRRLVPKAENLQSQSSGKNMASRFRSDLDSDSHTDASDKHLSVQTSRQKHLKLTEHAIKLSRDNSSDGNMLFDSLRDAIYAEVASLISQNESRPHFLLELFRDMQRVDSDFMRQCTLHSLQELLKTQPKMKSTDYTTDVAVWELSHDENAALEECEDVKACFQGELAANERGRLERPIKNSSSWTAPFDYAETADNPSSLSTPTDCTEESPFFQDPLAETVLEFDSLKRLGEARQRPSQGAMSRKGRKGLSENERKGQKYLATVRSRAEGKGNSVSRREREQKFKQAQNHSVNSPVVDAANKSSDTNFPRIDMKRLDSEIKEIMMETIPVVKEHMDSVCSAQLLNFIRCLVISLTSQMGSQEFVRFFQHQLATILEGTLQKYEGRKMRDCGEDLLVDISDVLYNELAFFRLMQNLDSQGDPGVMKSFDWPAQDQDILMGNDTESQDTEEKDEDESEHVYKIELAPSETKPFTRIGSDEDDDEEDEEWSLNDPSDTAVSRDSVLEADGRAQTTAPPSDRPETLGAGESGTEKHDQEKPISPRLTEKRDHLKPTSPKQIEIKSQEKPTSPRQPERRSQGRPISPRQADKGGHIVATAHRHPEKSQEKPNSPRHSGLHLVAKHQGSSAEAQEIHSPRQSAVDAGLSLMNGTPNGRDSSPSGDEEAVVNDLPIRQDLPLQAPSASAVPSDSN